MPRQGVRLAAAVAIYGCAAAANAQIGPSISPADYFRLAAVFGADDRRAKPEWTRRETRLMRAIVEVVRTADMRRSGGTGFFLHDCQTIVTAAHVYHAPGRRRFRSPERAGLGFYDFTSQSAFRINGRRVRHIRSLAEYRKPAPDEVIIYLPDWTRDDFGRARHRSPRRGGRIGEDHRDFAIIKFGSPVESCAASSPIRLRPYSPRAMVACARASGRLSMGAFHGDLSGSSWQPAVQRRCSYVKVARRFRFPLGTDRAQMFGHDCDTHCGSSGAPILCRMEGEREPFLVAMNTQELLPRSVRVRPGDCRTRRPHRVRSSAAAKTPNLGIRVGCDTALGRAINTMIPQAKFCPRAR
ncbi:MAG: trypsin-like peptidase domain-containing protein [Neomegalonema sp.]|nr:trypsin-like peptidase domain-containing protein [Neomegalonema sp.]